MSKMVRNVAVLGDFGFASDGVDGGVEPIEDNLGALRKLAYELRIPRPDGLQEGPKLLNGSPVVVEVVIEDGGEHAAARPHETRLGKFGLEHGRRAGEETFYGLLARELQVAELAARVPAYHLLQLLLVLLLTHVEVCFRQL